MISFFSVPKPFKEKYRIIQKNAILSWKVTHPGCEIFLFGDDEGIAEFSEEHTINHIYNIPKNKWGTPLLDFIFSYVHENSHNYIRCFINSDIILLENFISKIKHIHFDQYLLAGRRWDIDLDCLVDFSQKNWRDKLVNKVKNEGKLHPETGVDYFLFPTSVSYDIPAFAIGRGCWDNWIIYNSIIKDIPVVDGTEIMTIHQNHDYSHVKSINYKYNFKGVEMVLNRELANIKYWKSMHIRDATHLLIKGEVFAQSKLDRMERLIHRYFIKTLSIIKKKIKNIFNSILVIIIIS